MRRVPWALIGYLVLTGAVAAVFALLGLDDRHERWEDCVQRRETAETIIDAFGLYTVALGGASVEAAKTEEERQDKIRQYTSFRRQVDRELESLYPEKDCGPEPWWLSEPS